MMKNFLILSLLAMLSTHVYADTVRLNPDIDLVVNGVTDTSFTLNSEEPSGDATSESAPAVVYVPIKSAVVDQAKYFLSSLNNSVYSYLFDATDVSDTINFPMYVNIGGTTTYLYASVKDGTSYKLARAYPTSLINLTNSDFPFPISVKEICDQQTTATCASLAPTYNGSFEKEDVFVYFFISQSSGLTIGAAAEPATYPGGIYFKVNMSNRTYPSLTVTITNSRPGDRRAILTYSANANILKPKSVRILNTGGVTVSTATPIGQLTGDVLTKEYPYLQDSEMTVTDLANSTSYNLGVMFVDKYNFATKVSATAAVQPQEIEELLKKNACFLLTAGFGEDHYVIDYFRHFRDRVLSQSYLGRAFIHTYYELAPKYALIIYQHEGIRAVIRGIGYGLYFIFNYYVVIIGVALSGAGVLVYRRREKFRKVS